ncbi:MAG: glutaredoxin family protein [Planctomycetaceae bacterium]|nr:glutaredoxin family protein [Planctomycetaceae bacterium]
MRARTPWVLRANLARGNVIVSSSRIAHRFTARQAQFGTLLFVTGLAVLALAAWDNSSGLPFPMPSFWHSQRTICLLLALVIAALGLFVLGNGPLAEHEERRRASWGPARPGRRFRSLEVYSRDGCHLCEEAIELLQSYSAFLPPVQEVDIDTDPALRSRFDTEVPVVVIDGKVRFKGRVSEVLLRRLIEGTSPSRGDVA